MTAFTLPQDGNPTGKDKDRDRIAPNLALFLWRRFVELWIFAAIVIFFLIRVLASQTGRHFLGDFWHGRLP